MKKITISLIYIVLSFLILLPGAVYAREGDCGYEGGISSGEAPGKTSFEYQEVSFITGVPIVLKGTVTIKKSMKSDTISTVYTYSLKNTDKTAALTRTLNYTTKLTKKENGQTIEETALAKPASETFKIGQLNYVLKSYDFTRSCVVDSRPAVNYFAGNLWGKKIYQTGTSGSTGGGSTITVETLGNFYGYDQYWGTTEVETLDYTIQCDKGAGETADSWGGSVSVSLSMSTEKKLDYVKNQPNQISFDGGYVQTQQNSGILEYSCKLPEFDAKGYSTDNLVSKSGSLKLETFPVQTRLPVPDTKYLTGHWAENDINELFSLEVLKKTGSVFNPEQYISRAEFTDAFVRAAKEVPADPSLTSRTAAKRTTSKTSKQQIVSPFKDVSTDSSYFTSINSAYTRGLINGDGSAFRPGGKITLSDALVMFIRTLGLESMSPGQQPKTTFRDDAKIPSYARKAVYVAQKIGLAKADSKGYLNPGKYLTKANTAVLIDSFIEYMRSGIRTDYRDRIVNYN